MAPQHPTDTVNPDVLELAELLQPTWPAIRARYQAAGVPTCDGDPDPDPDPGKGDPDPDPDPGKGDPDPDDPEVWKQHSRKHEREAKKARKEADDLRAKLSARETADLSEQEKAIATAREEAKTEALSSVEKERRHDRLEVQVARLATKSFADVDDALLHLERGIERGDLDADDIFNSEGKVQTDALKSALDELLERKPHLAATAAGPGKNDAGKGTGGGKSDDDMTVDDYLKRIQKHK